MKFYKSFFDILVLILCFIFSGWMVKLQLDYFLENDDVASISFRNIEEGVEGQYPTYSICLFSDEGRIFRQDSSSWNYPHITSFNYHEFLRGWEPQTNTNDEELSKLQYDEVSLSIFHGTLLYFYGTRSNGTKVTKYDNETKAYLNISNEYN